MLGRDEEGLQAATAVLGCRELRAQGWRSAGAHQSQAGASWEGECNFGYQNLLSGLIFRVPSVW